MTREEILGSVQNIFRDVFDDPKLAIGDETNSKHIDDWDSLNHITLVSHIEKQMKIKFALGELQELQNVGEMITLIEKKISIL